MAVVGGGTAGLALARELKQLGAKSVIVIERETEAGGIPRHCGHYPFGIREYQRLMKGPEYARRNRDAAMAAGVEIRAATNVTKLLPEGRLELVDARGVYELSADRVVLCTGTRESSRAQRFVSGDRPLGIISTGALQSAVYLKGIQPFKNPVILGTELVSFSAIQTCRHLGIKPIAMVEEEERLRARRMFRPYLWLNRIPLYTGVTDLKIIGRERVEAITFEAADGNSRILETDGVIISGRFRPESALLRNSHLALDPGTNGPLVDQLGRCSDPTYYAAGNLLRPAETSSWCHAEARKVAQCIASDLTAPDTTETIAIKAADPRVSFVMPQRLAPAKPDAGLGCIYIGLSEPVDARLSAYSGGERIWSRHLRSRPLRRVTIPVAELLGGKVAGPIELKLED